LEQCPKKLEAMPQRTEGVARAEGGTIKAPKMQIGDGYWGMEGVSLPRRQGGLGERRELLWRGPGRRPGQERILAYFVATKRSFSHLNIDALSSSNSVSCHISGQGQG